MSNPDKIGWSKDKPHIFGLIDYLGEDTVLKLEKTMLHSDYSAIFLDNKGNLTNSVNNHVYGNITTFRKIENGLELLDQEYFAWVLYDSESGMLIPSKAGGNVVPFREALLRVCKKRRIGPKTFRSKLAKALSENDFGYLSNTKNITILTRNIRLLNNIANERMTLSLLELTLKTLDLEIDFLVPQI